MNKSKATKRRASDESTSGQSIKRFFKSADKKPAILEQSIASPEHSSSVYDEPDLSQSEWKPRQTPNAVHRAQKKAEFSGRAVSSQLHFILEDEEDEVGSSANTARQAQQIESEPAPLDQRLGYRDPVHGELMLDPAAVRVMDTAQFQRLHGLKQLGTAGWVFRGATHTRFEHSLGVAHLAEEMVRSLRRHQPYLGIDDVDQRCVMLAGLCHDLGHGPYSHVWDGPFMGAARPERKWSHEEGSELMLDALLAENRLSPADLGLAGPRDLLFIKELIRGAPEGERRGRGRGKWFLYDIVSNGRSGLDVDKLDYFERDAAATGVNAAGRFDRLLTTARVARVRAAGGEERLHLCYPEKMAVECLEFFHTRRKLHRQVYQHKATVAAQLMVVDALRAAGEGGFRARGTPTAARPDGLYRLSEAVDDPALAAYGGLRDSVLDLIAADPAPGLRGARAVLARLARRDLYKCVGSINISPGEEDMKADVILQEIIECAGGGPAAGVDRGEVRVSKVDVHMGCREQNPLERMHFFKKGIDFHKDFAYPIDPRRIETELPRHFQTKSVRVYCTSADPQKQDAVRRAFKLWCDERDSQLCPTLSQHH